VNVNTSVAIVNATMWIATASAIIAGLILTERIAILWFFLIPALSAMTTKYETTKGSEAKDEANI